VGKKWEKGKGRVGELHNVAHHNLYSNIMVKEGKANYCEDIAQTFINTRH
jgi:hypothetical protein